MDVRDVQLSGAHGLEEPDVYKRQVLVNFDPDRALRTAQTFGDLASSQEGSPGHQLLYFTCHPHMADMLRKAVPGVGLYVMERGTIREEE